MATFFIVSVGTSLIGKNNEHNKDQPVSVHEADWRYDSDEYEDWLSEFIEDTKEESLPDISAELSSLLRDETLRPGKDDTILLLHTDTKSSASCAEHIKTALKRLEIPDVRLRKVEKLSEAGAQDFYDQGLPNLLTGLHDEITAARQTGYEVVLIPTGGYKAIIPYFVLIGILMRTPCRYIYEDSDKVVELPPLPLHADLPRWTGTEAILETLSGKPSDKALGWSVWQSCQNILTNLLIRDPRGNLMRSPLCEVLQARVKADRRRPELQFRTQNSPLLLYLGNGNDSSLRHMFLRLADIGPYVWKGDRVPEMADHALLHHADLFHLAERILLPVFYHHEQEMGEPFLSPEELFVLLGALHLHDCGHVVGAVDLEDGTRHRLLPTEVRDYHHILGYLRLTDPDRHGGTGRWIHQALMQPVSDGSAGARAWTEDDLRDALGAIATLGLYHRKAMKLCQTEAESGKYPCPFVKGAEFGPIPCLDEFLKHHPVKVGAEELKPERLRLVISLLRIIDSLDEQGSRTGGKEAVRFHLEQLETEIRDEKERADGLRAAFEAVENAFRSLGKPATSVCEQLDDLAASLFSSYKGKESKEGAGKIVKKDTPTFWAEFEEMFPNQENGQIHPLKSLALEYVFSRIRAKFKGFQKEPYGEKLYVEGVDIRHRSEDGKIIFQIDLSMDQEYRSDPEGKKNPKNLLRSMSEEYEIAEKINGSDCKIVRKTLEDAEIVFEYQ